MEEIKSLLEGLGVSKEILSEDTIGKVSVMFESKLNEMKLEAKEELEEKNQEEITAFKTDLVEKMDSYLDYFTTEFINENEQQVEDTVKVKTAERILEKFDELVNEELQEKYNEAVNLNIELMDKLEESHRISTIEKIAESIEVSSDKERFLQLAENFEYSDAETFEKKVRFLKESINVEGVNGESKEESVLEEKEVQESVSQKIKPLNEKNDKMSKYLQYIEL